MQDNSFLQMVSVATAGGSVINYSDRFSLTGMTGTFPAAVIAANALVTSATGPDTVNGVTDGTATTSSGAAAGVWGTPYNEQTGLTRYAPMQPFPGTTITATNTVPLWPTSSVSIATTFMSEPSIVTTLTQSGTYSYTSQANTVSFEANIILHELTLLGRGCILSHPRCHAEVFEPLEGLGCDILRFIPSSRCLDNLEGQRNWEHMQTRLGFCLIGWSKAYLV